MRTIKVSSQSLACHSELPLYIKHHSSHTKRDQLTHAHSSWLDVRPNAPACEHTSSSYESVNKNKLENTSMRHDVCTKPDIIPQTHQNHIHCSTYTSLPPPPIFAIIWKMYGRKKTIETREHTKIPENKTGGP